MRKKFADTFGIEIIEEERCLNKMFFEFLQNFGFGVNMKKCIKHPPSSRNCKNGI
jgi:hypothetical protein